MILQHIRIMVGDAGFDPRTTAYRSVIFRLKINKLLKLLLLEVVILYTNTDKGCSMCAEQCCNLITKMYTITIEFTNILL